MFVMYPVIMIIPQVNEWEAPTLSIPNSTGNETECRILIAGEIMSA